MSNDKFFRIFGLLYTGRKYIQYLQQLHLRNVPLIHQPFDWKAFNGIKSF